MFIPMLIVDWLGILPIVVVLLNASCLLKGLGVGGGCTWDGIMQGWHYGCWWLQRNHVSNHGWSHGNCSSSCCWPNGNCMCIYYFVNQINKIVNNLQSCIGLVGNWSSYNRISLVLVWQFCNPSSFANTFGSSTSMCSFGWSHMAYDVRAHYKEQITLFHNPIKYVICCKKVHSYIISNPIMS
jgi:hypothetical protein